MQPVAPSAAGPEQLLDSAAQQPGLPLPGRAWLEQRTGQSLADVRVYANDDARAALRLLGARAAARDRRIFLTEPTPPPALLLHEVVHALQAAPGRLDGANGIVPAAGAAEQEALELTREGLSAADPGARPGAANDERAGRPPMVQQQIGARAIALLRRSEPYFASVGATADLRDSAFLRALGEASPEPDTSAGAIKGTAAVATSTPSGTAGDVSEDRMAPAVTDRAPTAAQLTVAAEPPEGNVEPTASSVPTTAAAQVAPQTEAQDAARQAVGGAGNLQDLVAAFAAAPPTVKAQQAPDLGQRAARLARDEATSFQAGLPPVQAELHADAATIARTPVAPPEMRPVVLEESAPPPMPVTDIAPTAEPGRFAGNADIATDTSRVLSGEPEVRGAQLGAQLRDVRTSDTDIVTSTGLVPGVPLAGATDPARMVAQANAGVAQAHQARDEFRQSVVEGADPSLAQGTEAHASVALTDLQQPDVEMPVVPSGPQDYLAMALPPEVQAAFDLQQQAPMAESMAEARAKTDQATAERDRDRQAALSAADQQAKDHSTRADTAQREKVQQARKDIGDARQGALEEQAKAVTDIEVDTEARRSKDRLDIDNRVRDDGEQINARYDQAERDAKALVQDGEGQAAAEKQKAEKAATDESWWNRALSFVRAALQALTSVINDIFNRIRRTVGGILDSAKKFAKGVIDAGASFVNKAITSFGTYVGAQVTDLLGKRFPGLAAGLNTAIGGIVTWAKDRVNEVAADLKSGVERVADGLKTGLDGALAAYQGAVNTAMNVVGAALTGDWSTLARMALEAVLKVVGIDPEEFYAFVGRAMDTFRLIVNDPGTFLHHCLNAVFGGLQRFGDNFLTHLQVGIIGWLTGTLGSAGIKLPEHFDLMGVLSLVQQILGLTWERLRQKAVKVIGEKNVERIEFVADYLKTLVDGGWSGLFERIQQDLGNLRDQVLEGIKSFLVERVIVAAVKKIATMFNPVGAIVQLVLTAYNLFTFLRDQLQRIMQVVQTVVNAIGDIARGIIEPATMKIEEVLARLLPLALDLLARVFGLGDVGGKVREILVRVQGVVDKAIDGLIDRVMKMFKGRGPESQAPAKTAETSDLVEPVTIGHESHRVRLHVDGGRVEMYMASNKEREFAELILELRQSIPRLEDKAEEAYLSDQLAIAESLYQSIKREFPSIAIAAGTPATAVGPPAKPSNAEAPLRRRIDQVVETIVEAYQWAMTVPSDLKPGKFEYQGVGELAGRARGWLKIQKKDRKSSSLQGKVSKPINSFISELRGMGYKASENFGFDAGHLVAFILGGEDTLNNLVPEDNTMNRSDIRTLEKQVRDFMKPPNGKRIHRSVHADITAIYGHDPLAGIVDERDMIVAYRGKTKDLRKRAGEVFRTVPKAVTCTYTYLIENGGRKPLVSTSFLTRQGYFGLQKPRTMRETRRALLGQLESQRVADIYFTPPGQLDEDGN